MIIPSNNLRPKKSLGQNFLQDQNILNIIASAGNIQKTETVLEIGPGKGALTKKLLQLANNVVAVEKDRNLVAYLQDLFNEEIDQKKLLLLEKDVLEFQEESFLWWVEYKLVANIPYNISGKIIKKFLYLSPHKPETMILLVQKEFAEKLRATKKGFDNKLAVLVNLLAEISFIKKVSRGCFFPVPKVDSQVIKLFLKKDSLVNSLNKEQQKKVYTLLGNSFQNKRKKLIRNLEWSFSFDLEKWQRIFTEIGLDFNIRADAVDLNNWQELIKRVVT